MLISGLDVCTVGNVDDFGKDVRFLPTVDKVGTVVVLVKGIGLSDDTIGSDVKVDTVEVGALSVDAAEELLVAIGDCGDEVFNVIVEATSCFLHND